MSNNEILILKKKLLATGIRIGTQVKTKFMKQFITKANPEGLYMLNMNLILERIQIAAKFINRITPEKIIVCSGKEYAITPIEMFCELTGAKKILGRFMPGTLTNPSLPYYIEPKLVLISDPQIDIQAIREATNAGIPVIGIANTDNITSNVDLIIPANNKGRKSLATIYWLLTQEVLLNTGKLSHNEKMKYEIDDFETKTIGDDVN
ncbi:MAG: 30S ribosomal protein S2 [Thaumarchaeota archaeon]|nr:30S ribosomal protein S2 [Nitrososphaerota archaeon]MCY3976146.1 30S ribosomal protein S2 [Nitrososphaerota archaeon]